MFGAQYLFFLDIIVILWGAYMSTMCLCLYLCADRALCQEYRNFFQTLKDKIKNKSIMKPEIIEEIEAQLIDYLILVKFINDNVSRILQTSFIFGLFMDLTSHFCISVYGEYIGIDKGLFGIWLVVGVCFLAISIRTPSVFRSLVLKTIDALYLDHGIWRECTDENVKKVARDMVNRLNDADYGSKSAAFASASTILFNLIVIVSPFIVSLLTPYAIKPSYKLP